MIAGEPEMNGDVLRCPYGLQQLTVLIAEIDAAGLF
jgi:hypothetical protein